jgi:dCMP deaminase
MSNKYDKVMVECAKVWSQESYCTKAKVGAVLADDGRIVATGYNGTIKGLSNECEFPEYFDGETEEVLLKAPFYCPVKKKHYKLKTSPFVVHAEQNVISFCAKEGIATNGLTMYVTLSPCENCAKLIASVGIKKVVYLEEYKRTEGIQFLKDCNVEVIKYKGEENV